MIVLRLKALDDHFAANPDPALLVLCQRLDVSYQGVELVRPGELRLAGAQAAERHLLDATAQRGHIDATVAARQHLHHIVGAQRCGVALLVAEGPDGGLAPVARRGGIDGQQAGGSRGDDESVGSMRDAAHLEKGIARILFQVVAGVDEAQRVGWPDHVDTTCEGGYPDVASSVLVNVVYFWAADAVAVCRVGRVVSHAPLCIDDVEAVALGANPQAVLGVLEQRIDLA